MKLTCERTREVLWPLDRPRTHVSEEESARSHLTRCRGCRAFFLRDAELARLLRRAGEGMAVAPAPGLRMAVAEVLAEPLPHEAHGDSATHVLEIPRQGARRGFGGRRAELAAAAAAVLLLLGGRLLASQYGGAPDTARFAADFVRTAAVDFDQPGLDVRQIGSFYERELGRSIVPVALHEAPVTRATVCDLRGDLGSMIEYDLGGTRLVHYRIPLDPDRPGPKRTEVVLGSNHGVQVAHWSDFDFEHALVARAPGEELAWLAENRFNGPPAVTNYGSPASRSWRPVIGSD